MAGKYLFRKLRIADPASPYHRKLVDILAPAAFLPYWVGVGNHELHNNRDPRAREHTARFLSSVEAGLGPERLYYAKRVGPAFFLFLDSLRSTAARAAGTSGSAGLAASRGRLSG